MRDFKTPGVLVTVGVFGWVRVAFEIVKVTSIDPAAYVGVEAAVARTTQSPVPEKVKTAVLELMEHEVLVLLTKEYVMVPPSLVDARELGVAGDPVTSKVVVGDQVTV